MRPYGSLASVLLFVLSVSTHGGGAWAKDLVLRLAAPVGTVIAFDETATLETTTTLEGSGRPTDIPRRVEIHRIGTTEILEIGAHGAPAEVGVTFDPASSIEVNGTTEDRPFPFAGQTMTVTWNGRHVGIWPDPGDMDDDTRRQLTTYLNLTRTYMPNAPVPIGGTWTGYLPLAGTGATTFTLVGLSERDGRRVAETAFASTLSGPIQGMTIDGRGEGTATFDVATGTLARMTFEGVGALSGQAKAHGVTSDIEGTAEIVVTVTGRMMAPGAAVEAATSADPLASKAMVDDAAAAAATPSATMPLPPINPGPRPPDHLGPRTFADDAIALTVTSNDLSLTRDGRTFRGAVTKRYGDHWQGYVEMNGTIVSMQAVQTGGRLTLETGGATYDLTAE